MKLTTPTIFAALLATSHAGAITNVKRGTVISVASTTSITSTTSSSIGLTSTTSATSTSASSATSSSNLSSTSPLTTSSSFATSSSSLSSTSSPVETSTTSSTGSSSITTSSVGLPSTTQQSTTSPFTTSTSTSATSTAPAQCTAGAETIYGRSCTKTCGLDRPGGDYASLQTNSFESCAQACASEAKCVSAQFNEANGYCYLKAVSDSPVSSPTVDTVDCKPVAPQCIPGTRLVGTRFCTVSCGLDRPGGDYSSQQTWSFEQCIQLCAADTKCVTVQYHEGNGFCYFKNTKNPGVASTGDDTADCQPPPLLPNGSPCSIATASLCAADYCNSNGECGKLADGQGICGSNADCQNGFCNGYGSCGKLPDGASCTAAIASSCASGICNANGKCGRLADGQGYCRNNNDCTNGFCNSRAVCGLVKDGGGCDYDSDCVSKLCNCGANGPRNCGFGVCGLGAVGSGCLGNYQCASGLCYNQACQASST